jgi:hypothetical protein
MLRLHAAGVPAVGCTVMCMSHAADVPQHTFWFLSDAVSISAHTFDALNAHACSVTMTAMLGCRADSAADYSTGQGRAGPADYSVADYSTSIS